MGERERCRGTLTPQRTWTALSLSHPEDKTHYGVAGYGPHLRGRGAARRVRGIRSARLRSRRGQGGSGARQPPGLAPPRWRREMTGQRETARPDKPGRLGREARGQRAYIDGATAWARAGDARASACYGPVGCPPPRRHGRAI